MLTSAKLCTSVQATSYSVATWYNRGGEGRGDQATTAGRPPTKHRQYPNRLQRIFITQTRILSSNSTNNMLGLN
jgi:hypothetical protein